jgi:hypothetical protein
MKEDRERRLGSSSKSLVMVIHGGELPESLEAKDEWIGSCEFE